VTATASSPNQERFPFSSMRTAASRQGSYTPQPVTASPQPQNLSPALGHPALNLATIFSPSARTLRRGASPAPPDHPRRTWSYTPLPITMNPVSPPGSVEDQLSHSITNVVLPAGIASSGGALASPSSVSLDASYQRQQDWLSGRGAAPSSQDWLPSAKTSTTPTAEDTMPRRRPRQNTVSPQRNADQQLTSRCLDTVVAPTLPCSQDPSPTAAGAAAASVASAAAAIAASAQQPNGPLMPRRTPDPSPSGKTAQQPSWEGIEPRDGLSTELVVGVERFTHRPRMSSLPQGIDKPDSTPPLASTLGSQPQATTPVSVNVYWQRSVAFDEQGRVVRRLGDELSWGKKLVKDIIGVYHIGVEVHSDEYTFGTYHAPSMKQIGDEGSGVCRHDPQRPGPQFVFKLGHPIGFTAKTREQVKEICEELGKGSWGKSSYNRIHHNCVDFARALCEKLGAGDIPLWCYRGAAAAKLLGIGGEPPLQANGNSTVMHPLPHETAYEQFPRGAMTVGGIQTATMPAMRLAALTVNSEACMQLAEQLAASDAGTAPAVSTLPSLAAAPAMAAVEQLTVQPSPNSLKVGRAVSVFQNMGHWNRAQIVCQDPDGKYTVAYNDTRATEAGVAASRIVPLPEVPRETTALAQAFYLDESTSGGGFNGLGRPSFVDGAATGLWTGFNDKVGQQQPGLGAGLLAASTSPCYTTPAAAQLRYSLAAAAAAPALASFTPIAPSIARGVGMQVPPCCPWTCHRPTNGAAWQSST